MTDALRLEVKKDAWGQLQSGNYKLTVTLNPTDLDDNTQGLLMDFIKAPMGTVYMLGMARVGDDGQPAQAAPAPPEKPKKRFEDYSLAEQAGMRCNDVEFQGFLSEKYPADWEILKQSAGTRDTTETMAAALVRRCCGGIGGLLSRRELDTDEGAANRWKSLNAEYEQHAGLAPQAR